MEPTEKLIAGAFVTVVGVGMLGTCSRNRSSHETIRYSSQTPSSQNIKSVQYTPEPVQTPSLDVNSSEARAAAGVINLNEVRDAFRATQEMALFEQRVNEIYEGEQMVVFEAKEASGGFKLFGREDLDGSKSTTSGDDLLFTLSVKSREATLQGHGINSYYKETWLYEPPADAATRVTEVHHRSSVTSSPFFWYWVMSPGWGGYYTPMSRYDSMYAHRRTYRSSAAYGTQRSRNTTYAQNRGSSFRSSSNTMSSQRKSYVSKKPSTSGYKQKVVASSKKTGTSAKSQKRTTSTSKKSSYSGSSKKSSSSKGFGSYRGSSGF